MSYYSPMLVFTIIMFTPLIPDSRIQLLTDVSNLFYLAQAASFHACLWTTENEKSNDK